MSSLVSLFTAMNGQNQALMNTFEAQEGLYNLISEAPRFASQGIAGLREASALDTKLHMSLLLNQFRSLFFSAWKKEAEKMVQEDLKQRFNKFM